MSRAIDHLVLAARGLDALAEFYRRLGFLVGGCNQHPWGTENHIAQLEGSFLELLGLAPGFTRLKTGEPAAAFANTLAQSIEERDGLALVALQSSDALADARDFAAAGIGYGTPLHFSRTAEAADGTRREVAFTTAFTAETPEATPEFFVCQHHRPENFWNPVMQRHPNGALRLIGIVMVADTPSTRSDFLTTLFGTGERPAEVLTPEAFLLAYGEAPAEGSPFAACRIEVASLDAAQAFFERETIPFSMIESRLVVSAAYAHGVTLSFEA